MSYIFQEINHWSCLRKNSDEMLAKADGCGILERISVRKEQILNWLELLFIGFINFYIHIIF